MEALKFMESKSQQALSNSISIWTQTVGYFMGETEVTPIIVDN